MDGKENYSKKIGEFLLEIIFPSKCPVCEEILGDKNENICSECKDSLSFIKEPVCCKCGRPLSDERNEYCKECKKNDCYKTLSFNVNRALLEHDEKTSKILYDFKYKNYRDNINFCVEEFYKRNYKLIQSWNAEVIIPVPLHKKRLIKRGFNQAEIISKRLSELTNIPIDVNLLERNIETIPQKELDKKERKKNVENSFKICEKIVKYNHIILIDDIYTTGSTITACASTIKNAGIDNVYCITMSIVV